MTPMNMPGYVANIEEETRSNDYFRKVLYTDSRLQLVVMSLLPGEDIGAETHSLDQFIRIEDGEGKVELNGDTHELDDDSVIIIPSGVKHNIINTSKKHALKLYTLYAPPNHPEGTVHKTKADALVDEHH